MFGTVRLMRSQKRSTRQRAGLSREAIIDYAVSQTESVGIDGWSMRDIAQGTGVVPSVLYHYFSNKEDLCDAVVERVCADIVLPDGGLGWKEWFTAMAHNMRPVLLRYHGITDRFARGKYTESFLPVLDAGYTKLMEAGFEKKAVLAYVIISNQVLAAISARNLRSDRQRGERHDLGKMLERLTPMMDSSPGLRTMIEDYLAPLSDPSREDDLSDEYYGLVIATVLDGVEHVLKPQQNQH